MRQPLADLARNPRFIPFVYDYCDMWCAGCQAQSRCLAYAVEQSRARDPAAADVADPVNEGLEFARAVAAAGGPDGSPVAELDVRLADPYTAPREPAMGHPLELLARHYATQSDAFLRSLDYSWGQPYSPDRPVAVLNWFHVMIAAKTYRALVSAFLAASGTRALEDDARGAAKVALIGIDRSMSAWRQLQAAGHEADGRVAGLVELLETLRTALEMRFPDARRFLRPGLDPADGGRVN